jgi:hypothetical protein
MDAIKSILTSPAVWAALLSLLNFLLKLYWSEYTPEMWAAVSGLIVAILAALGVTGVTPISAEIERRRSLRQK